MREEDKAWRVIRTNEDFTNLIEQLASNESGLTTTSTTSTATVKEMSTNHLPEQMEHKREINAQPTYLTRHFIRKISPPKKSAKIDTDAKTTVSEPTASKTSNINIGPKILNGKCIGESSTEGSNHKNIRDVSIGSQKRKRGRPRKYFNELAMPANRNNYNLKQHKSELASSAKNSNGINHRIVNPKSQTDFASNSKLEKGHQPELVGTFNKKALSHCELEAINFAAVNPLIVLCEVAKQQEETEMLKQYRNQCAKANHQLESSYQLGKQMSAESSSLPSIHSSTTEYEQAIETVYRNRIRMMSTSEARDHLTIVTLNLLCTGMRLIEMTIGTEPKERNDNQFHFNLPKACLKLLSPASVESLVEVVHQWIDFWIRQIDGRLGIELRSLSRITEMRWILIFAVPQLCIFYLKKVEKLNHEEAMRTFLGMESSRE